MDGVEHWKRMYTESARDIFLLKYNKIELEKRVDELENQEALRLIDELDLKHLLEDVKIKYDGLLVEFQEKKIECELVKSELKELSDSKIGVGNGFKEYQIMCNRWKDRRNKSLEEEKRIACEREKKENERITSLENEIMKLEGDRREKCVEFSKEIVELECRKRRVEDEIEIWKKKFEGSECRKRRAEDKVEIWKKKFKDSECANRRAEDKVRIWKRKFKESERGKRRAGDKVKILKKKFMDSECAKERIIKLEEDQREKCVEFSKEIIGLKAVNQRAEEEMEIWKKKYTELECEKRRADGEIELVKKRCRELKIQASEMLNHGAALEDYKIKYDGLSAALKVKEMECVDFEGKLKNLMSAKVALDHELEDYKTTCSRMKEEITGLTNVGKIMSEREKTSHDRIAYFEELVKKMESDEKDMLVQLKNENMVSERGKRRTEDETENWKKRFMELEMGLGSLQKEVGYADICEKYMDEYISRKMDGRVNAASVAHLTKSEKVLSPASLPATDFSSFHEMLFEDEHVSDTPDTKSQFDHSADFKVEKKNICSDTKVELVSEAKQQPGSETGGSCKENLVLLKQDSVTTSSICIIEIEDEVIEVSDGEDEKEIPLTHTCNNKGEDVEHASTDGTLETLNRYLKRPLSVWGSLDKNIQFSSTMKRCKVSTSQEDDKFPNIEI